MSADDASILSLLAEVRRQPLNIRNTMKNIFVTQLGDRRDEDEDVKYIPIIKEPAAEILAKDFRTPQSTLVLKKEVEVDLVNAELADKREEFLQRMEAITQKRAEFERKEQANKERVMKFDRFIKENEAKKCRAIKKHQLEVKENQVKQRELQDLLRQFEVIKARQQKLQKRVSNYKVYEDYLMEVIDNLPENYLDYGAESLVISIIQKYVTHRSTNETLITNLARLSDELEQQQHNLEAVHQENDTSKLMMNSQLSQLRMESDEMKEKNKRMEQKINLHRGHFIHQSEEVGALLLAVNNLAEQCYAKHYGILEEMSILIKLDMVKHGSVRIVSDQSEIRALGEDHPEDRIYQQKVQDISRKYAFFRRTLGDGNCFYRALSFAYLESLLENKKGVKKLRKKVIQSREELLAAGFAEKAFENSFSTFMDVIDLVEADGSVSKLLAVFNDRGASDHLVQYLRLLTSAYLQKQSEFFEFFLEGGISIKDFCAQEVEPMAVESDHIHITALTQALGISIQVEYMDKTDTEINHHIFPEGSKPLVYLLYKPGHYDILYKASNTK
ncbi:uncharacterized protein LOC144597434 isoform X1 [Rhinoraja longicauda]